jgi:DNA-binding IscR family transcriptional regulator
MVGLARSEYVESFNGAIGGIALAFDGGEEVLACLYRSW